MPLGVLKRILLDVFYRCTAEGVPRQGLGYLGAHRLSWGLRASAAGSLCNSADEGLPAARLLKLHVQMEPAFFIDSITSN